MQTNRRHPAGRRITGLVAIAILAGCASGTAIDNVTVIDAVHGARAGQTVVFVGDTITAVVPQESAPRAARRIDGTGRFLIPGLWDMHVHVSYEPRLTEAMPDLFLQYGITSVRDTGGLVDKVAPVVERWRAADAVAPRIYFAGPLLDGRDVVYNGDAVPEIGIRNEGPAAARANIERLSAAGVDFVKIYEMVDTATFDALVAAANEAGLPIAAHVPLAMLADEAGPRVDSMEHLRNVELACAANHAGLLAERRRLLQNPAAEPGYALRSAIHTAQRLPAIAAFDAQRCRDVAMALRATIQVPTTRLNALATHPPWERQDWAAAIADMPTALHDAWQQPPDWFSREPTFADFTLAMIGRLHRAGVPLGAGTDTPIGVAIPGYSLHNELELLVAAGLAPVDALAAATLRPAEFMRIDDVSGSIDVGKQADLVLLNANPLLDIRNTRDIAAVYFRGRRYRPE